jgi:hypothetical protein
LTDDVELCDDAFFFFFLPWRSIQYDKFSKDDDVTISFVDESSWPRCVDAKKAESIKRTDAQGQVVG